VQVLKETAAVILLSNMDGKTASVPKHLLLGVEIKIHALQTSWLDGGIFLMKRINECIILLLLAIINSMQHSPSWEENCSSFN
jgi:hypothetical protein